MTDSFTDLIAEWAASHAGVRPWLFVNRLSRLVVDPERFPDEREELNSVGMGAVYTRTSDGSVLRSPTVDEISGLVDRYFTPYADAFADLVDERLAAVGEVTIIDQHSYPLRAEAVRAARRRPAARGVHRHRPVPHSTEPGRHSRCLLLAAHAHRRRRFRLPVRRLLRAAAALQHDSNVSAVMIELRRDIYLEERFSTIPSGMRGSGRALADLIDQIELDR